MNHRVGIGLNLGVFVGFGAGSIGEALICQIEYNIIGGINALCYVTCDWLPVNGNAAVGKMDLCPFHLWCRKAASRKQKGKYDKTCKEFLHECTPIEFATINYTYVALENQSTAKKGPMNSQEPFATEDFPCVPLWRLVQYKKTGSEAHDGN